MFLEPSPGAEQLGIALHELVLRLAKLLRPRLPFELIEQRLGIERFEVARPAGHEQEDHGRRLGGKVRRFGCERVNDGRAGLLVVQERGQREPAEAAEGVADEFASRAGRQRVRVGAEIKGHRGTHSG